MKVILSDITFSYLFPGGKQVHAEKIFKNLKRKGIDVSYENWHDPSINGEIVHFFGFNDVKKIKALKERGYKLVYTHILDGLTNLPPRILYYHRIKNMIIRRLPSVFDAMFPWKALKYFDAIVYMHDNDRKTGVSLYNVDVEKTHIIPHAVDSLNEFSRTRNVKEEKYLVSLGSIVPRKNTLFTAELCKKNNIPIKFIGHPFDKNSEYFKEFISKVDGERVQYLDYVSEEEKSSVLEDASGFVLLSFGESGCISVYEAAAKGLPLLLSDLPWAKGYEDPKDINFASPYDFDNTEKSLLDFYNISSRRDFPTFTVYTWEQITEKYINVYQGC